MKLKKPDLLPLPPGEAAAERRVRESGVFVFTNPSSPTLFLYLQSCRYRNPGEYFPVFLLDGPMLLLRLLPHLAPEGEGSGQIMQKPL